MTRGMISTLLFTLILVGCTQQKLPQGMPDLFPHNILVLQDDKPLAGAYVQLKTDTHGYLVDGVTGTNGVAYLKTDGRYSGVPAGNYAVTVVKDVREESRYGYDAPITDDEYEQWSKNRASENLAVYSFVDPKYRSFETSDLKITVTKPGKSTVHVGKRLL